MGKYVETSGMHRGSLLAVFETSDGLRRDEVVLSWKFCASSLIVSKLLISVTLLRIDLPPVEETSSTAYLFDNYM